MPRLKAANFAETLLAEGIDAVATSFIVEDASMFPDEGPFRVVIDAEIMEVGTINKQGNVFSNVTRGVEGSVAVSHTAGTKVSNRFTAGTLMELLSKADDSGNVLGGDAKHSSSVAVHPTAVAGGKAADEDNISIGRGAKTGNLHASYTGKGHIAIGRGASTQVNLGAGTHDMIAIGTETEAKHDSAIVIGVGSKSLDDRAIVMSGYYGQAGFESIAVGWGVTAEGTRSVVIGPDFASTGTADHAVAIGSGAHAERDNSVALGSHAAVTEANQGVLGVPDGDPGPYNWLIPGNLRVEGKIDNLFGVLPRRVGATPNRWYAAGQVTAAALTTGAPTANILRAMPFLVPHTSVLDRLAINVTTAATGNARLGIYADDGNCYPSSRVVDAGAVSTGTTGVKTLNIATVLDPGLYWLVLVSDAAPTIRALTIGSCMPILGADSTLGTASGVGWVVSFTYGALPSSFPAGATALTAEPIPAIFVRVSTSV